MTHEEYQRICERLARKATRYALEMIFCEGLARQAAPQAIKAPSDDNVTDDREHWIDVFLDERLPDLDADALLDVTRHADAYEKAAGRPAPSREIAAYHAFQADVWDAINNTKDTP